MCKVLTSVIWRENKPQCNGTKRKKNVTHKQDDNIDKVYVTYHTSRVG